MAFLVLILCRIQPKKYRMRQISSQPHPDPNHSTHQFIYIQSKLLLNFLEYCGSGGSCSIRRGWCPVPRNLQSPSFKCLAFIVCLTNGSKLISNYWMRLSRIWRILQIKEGVIHRGWRPRCITPSEICIILHILRKPNSIIAFYSFKIFCP